jgi:excisionase family DNA binding protein
MGHPAEKRSPGIAVFSAGELDELIAKAVANGVELAMDKLDRARAAQVMNTKELAEHLGKSERTLANWVKKGMPHFFVGNDRRYRRGEVEEWLKTFKG